MRSIAERRSPEAIKLAEATIESAKAVSADEAKSAGLVDFIATDLNDLLKQLDGFSVQMESGPRTLHTANAVTRILPMNFGEANPGHPDRHEHRLFTDDRRPAGHSD